MTSKISTKTVRSLLHADQITAHKNGTFTARDEFFYTHGRTEQDLIDKVLAAFPQATILSSGEIWKPFRGGASTQQSSHWFVTFSL